MSSSLPSRPFSNENKYQYQPLPTQSSFRLVELLPSQHEDAISYNLHLAEIGTSKLYEALSYTWNDPNIQVSSYCDGKCLPITPNLHAALKSLRLITESKWLWADAISINQEDVAERSEQVKHMLNVYQNSTGVTVWLGPDETDEIGDSKALNAKILIDDITTGLIKSTGHVLWTDPGDFSVTKFPEFSKSMPSDANQRTQLVLQNLHKIEDLSPFTQHVKTAVYASHPRLPALIWLFSRPWFQRMWVVQEVNAITNITVLCGDVSISWDRLGLAAAFIPTTWFELEELEPLFHDSFISNADKMRHRSALRNWSVYQIMSYTSDFRATDPRDQIYGKLGLRPFAESGMHVEPDYGKSVKRVFMDFTVSGMDHFRNLDILSFVGLTNAQRDYIPSWVPLWDDNMVTRSILNGFGGWNWNANGDRLQEIPVMVLNDSLFVRGIVFNRVLRHVEIDPEGWRKKYAKTKQNTLYRLWQREGRSDISASAVSCVPEDSRFLHLAASMVAGVKYSYKRITDEWGAFQDQITSYLNLSVCDEDETRPLELTEPELDWHHYRCRAHACTVGRVLFETRSNHVGLGPEWLQVDDLVCILYGGKVPFILRPMGDHYTFVGESYVHGLMDGEAVSMFKRGALKEQEFEIR